RVGILSVIWSGWVRTIGRAALPSAAARPAVLPGFAVAGPVPRRVAALLAPPPPPRAWPPAGTAVGLALWGAVVGVTVSALSSANSALTLYAVLKAATPL
ncbi:M56 family peptidase, partial [Streptomyces roseolus]